MRDYQVSFAMGLLAVLAPLGASAQTVEEGASLDELVVTGSRIARQDYSASTPVVTLGAEAVEKTGAVTLDTVLKQQPQFVASTGSTTNSNSNGGQANVQLRGLGRQRTLVLLDGRRLPAANSDGSVDLNAIPTALVENVEIITGGASAVYGSDAVAGVVNIRTRRNVTGLELSAQYGVSDQGDAEDYKIGLVFGGPFADNRGSSVFSVEYANRKPIFLADRGFSVGASRDSRIPTGLVSFASGAPSQAAIDQVFGRYGVGAGVVRGTNEFGFNPDGTLFSTGQTVQNFKLGADPLYFSNGSQVQAEGRQYRFLQLPLETYSFFNRTRYELTETTRVFAQLMYTNNTASTQLNPLPASSNATTGFPLVPVTNPFIPADLRTLLASRANPNAPLAVSQRFDVLGGRLAETRNDTFQIVGGADGKLPFGDWTWNLTGSFGKNAIDNVRIRWPSRSALQALVTAADGGRSICEGGYNPFGANPISAACANYIGKTVTIQSDIEQQVLEANFQGKLFDLPAGPVRAAVGADYREDYFRTEADPSIIAGDIIAASGANFAGRTNVKELYAELLIPLLADLPFVKELSADVGGRVSDYSSVGGVATYKADLSWKVVDSLTLRGGYERAIRAPSVGELFTPVVQAFTIIGLAGSLGSGDPCDVRGAYRTGPDGAKVRALCLATGVPASLADTYTFAAQSAGNLSGGNPNLQEETANTFSVGAVWRPVSDNPLFANLSASLDYYNIEVKDAVGSITAQLVLSRCFNATGSTNPTYDPANIFCRQITRNENGTIFAVSQQSLNLAGYKTAGVDLQVDWRFDTEALGLNDGGAVSLNLLTSYLDTFKIKSLPGEAFLEYANTIGNGQIDPVAITRPRWKSNLYASYTLGPVSGGLTWRYIGKAENAANVGAVNPTAVGVPSVSYFDLNARWVMSERLEFWGVIANLTDKTPPIYPAVGSTDLATYDAIGRRVTVGLKARF